jgi:hypothetical protein
MDIHQALQHAINTVNFGTTSGHQYPKDGIKVASSQDLPYSEPLVMIQAKASNDTTAAQVVKFWAVMIRRFYDGDFVVSMFVKDNFTPVQFSCID